MGDEFTAWLPSGVDVLSLVERIADELVNEGICSLVSSESSDKLLKWTDAPRRENWPEDLALTAIDGRLMLTVHSGTRLQREVLMKRMEDIASRQIGHSVTFEEV